VLASYELLSDLGGGELCSVHRARLLMPAGRSGEVALKRLRPGANPAAGRARLLREARVGVSVRAANLVRVLELHDEPELFLVLEHIDGASLHELLARAASIDAVRYVLPMFVDALHGLSALHQWKNEEGAPSFLVHQAPSARHMLAGDDGITRLIDLAYVQGPGLPAVAQLRPPATANAFAPEQFDSSQGLDPRCDIFLVGVALQEALACLGSLTIDPHWAALHAVADRAREPKRSARFWSADEMAYALRNAAEDAGAFAAPAEVGAWVQRTRLGLRGPHRAEPARQTRAALALPPPQLSALAPLTYVSEPTAYEDEERPAEELLTTIWQPPAAVDVLLDPAYEAHARPARRTQRSALSATTLVAQAQRAVSSTEATVLIRDFAPPSPARRLLAAAALAAALSAALAFGLRGAQTPTASAAKLERIQRPSASLPADMPPPALEAPSPAPAPSVPKTRQRPRATELTAPGVAANDVAQSDVGSDAASAAGAAEPSAAPVERQPEELPPNPYQ
jgi:hypothetical protein